MFEIKLLYFSLLNLSHCPVFNRIQSSFCSSIQKHWSTDEICNKWPTFAFGALFDLPIISPRTYLWFNQQFALTLSLYQ